MPSLFQLHCDRWKHGCGAKECGGSDGLGHGVKVCLARGQIPCDILLVGEAPGESENVIGVPFCGPAGGLLEEKVVRRAVPPGFRAAYANLAGCIPRDWATGEKVGEPSADQIQRCAPRLVELVTLADPGLIVCVGRVAETWLDPNWASAVKLHKVCKVCLHKQTKTRSGVICPEDHRGAESVIIPRLAIQHPAYILRQNRAQQGLLVQRCMIQLMDAVEELAKCRSPRNGPKNSTGAPRAPSAKRLEAGPYPGRSLARPAPRDSH